LLLLLVAKTGDLSLLTTFKRVRSFDSLDVDLLAVILKDLHRLATTPHILAETSNFIDQAPRYRRAELVGILKEFIAQQEEVYEDARTLSVRAEFEALGITDTALSSLSLRFTVITTDFELSGRIASVGGSAINFRQIRSRRIWPTL
jgi:hypothetical protein